MIRHGPDRIHDDRSTEQVSVPTGLSAGDRIEVPGELQVGDRVVVRGTERLATGMSVTIVDGNPAEAGGVANSVANP